MHLSQLIACKSGCGACRNMTNLARHDTPTLLVPDLCDSPSISRTEILQDIQIFILDQLLSVFISMFALLLFLVFRFLVLLLC